MAQSHMNGAHKGTRTHSWSLVSIACKLLYYPIYIYVYISSSSSCWAISKDLLSPLSPPLLIVDCFGQVLRATSRIGTNLLYTGSTWWSCICSSMWRGPQGYITCELVLTSPAVSSMSGSSNFDSFRDGW